MPDRLAAIDVTRTPLAEVPVDRAEAAGTDDWLFSAADGMVAPFADIPTVIAAIRRPFRDASEVTGRPGAIRPDVSGSRRQEFEHDGVMIRETIVRFGRLGLSGILSEPASVDADVGGPAYVAITALGPGRLFPDFARRAAARGRTCLRFDLAGFGTSPRRPGDGWADFYDPEAPAEIADAIDHVTRRGHDDVVLVAFCAGAWSAVQMAPHPAVRRIVGINLQLFIRHRLLHRRPWPDLPPTKQVLASIGQRRNVRRVVKRLQFSHPLPSPTLRWIRRHRRAGVDVMLVFAEEDRGAGTTATAPSRRGRPSCGGLPTVRRYEGWATFRRGPPAPHARRHPVRRLSDEQRQARISVRASCRLATESNVARFRNRSGNSTSKWSSSASMTLTAAWELSPASNRLSASPRESTAAESRPWSAST